MFKGTTRLIDRCAMTISRLYMVQVGKVPSEETAWLTASELRNAEVVLEVPATRTDMHRRSAGQAVLLDLAVALQMLPVIMTGQAVQQQLLQLGLRRLQEALRNLILPDMSGAKKHDRALPEKQQLFGGIGASMAAARPEWRLQL